MSGWSWLAYLLLVGVAGAGTAWLYLRREPSGPGRLSLVALRTLALALLLLLLFDPSWPAAGRGGRRHAPVVLLDASASMALPASRVDSTSRWRRAAQEARRRGAQVWFFGSAVRPAGPGALPGSPPGDARSQVLPALRAAAEAGAERVVVVSDGALESAGTLPEWLARLGLGVEWVTVGEPLGGLSLPGVVAPAWAVAGTPVRLEITLAAASPSPDSARLVVRQGTRELQDTLVPAPPAGRTRTVALEVRPAAPPGGAHVRLEVALEPGDVLAADDRRFVSLLVSEEPAGLTLLSLQPGQEPRFLLPTLAEAVGVPARGYLRTAAGWVRTGRGDAAGRQAPEEEVRRSAAAAELLVVEAGGEDPPPWLGPLLRSGPPLLLLYPAPGAAAAVPVDAGAPVNADWFLQPELPPSPVAALLAGAVPPDLPPLPVLYPAALPPGAWAPLLVTRGRSAERRPLLVAGQLEGGGRRWAVALAEGYWRWAFRGGSGRALYDRLWSAVAGWLLAGAPAAGEGVRPVARVMAMGEPSRWVTPGQRPDSLRLRIADTAGRPVTDTVLRTPAGDTLQAPVLPPGVYAYRARAFAGGRQLAGAGELAVESWAPELARPRLRLDAVAAPDPVGPGGPRSGGRSPLHTSPVPYVLLVLLLSAEWILRRRRGLR